MISTSADSSETPDGKPIPAKRETVPERYNARTELEYVVESGKRMPVPPDGTRAPPQQGSNRNQLSLLRCSG